MLRSTEPIREYVEEIHKELDEAHERLSEAEEKLGEAEDILDGIEKVKVKVKVGFGVFFFIVSIFINLLQFYTIHKHSLPQASYVSFVGINDRGHCVTGQEFLNYNPDSKAAVQNTVKAIETFQNIRNVVLVNKWVVSNDMSEPPHIKVVYRDGKRVFQNEF